MEEELLSSAVSPKNASFLVSEEEIEGNSSSIEASFSLETDDDDDDDDDNDDDDDGSDVVDVISSVCFVAERKVDTGERGELNSIDAGDDDADADADDDDCDDDDDAEEEEEDRSGAEEETR